MISVLRILVGEVIAQECGFPVREEVRDCGRDFVLLQVVGKVSVGVGTTRSLSPLL